MYRFVTESTEEQILLKRWTPSVHGQHFLRSKRVNVCNLHRAELEADSAPTLLLLAKPMGTACFTGLLLFGTGLSTSNFWWGTGVRVSRSVPQDWGQKWITPWRWLMFQHGLTAFCHQIPTNQNMIKSHGEGEHIQKQGKCQVALLFMYFDYSVNYWNVSAFNFKNNYFTSSDWVIMEIC